MGQDKLELLRGDAALVVLAEHPERLLQLVLGVRVAQLLVHHEAELRKLKKAGSINVHLGEVYSLNWRPFLSTSVINWVKSFTFIFPKY